MATESVATEQQRPRTLDLRAPPKASKCSVVGLIPQRGEWVAVYSVMRLGKGDGPTIVDVCSVSDLPGPQRKRADLWMHAFGRFIEAGTPTGSLPA